MSFDRTKSSHGTRYFFSFVTAFILLFAGCDPAQSKSVPLTFTREHFEEIKHYTLNNYIDPDDINVSRAYIGAAEVALESLPYPLVLLPKGFYTKRNEIQVPERIIPGKTVSISEDDPYLILVPDYKKWEKQNKALEKKRKAKMDRMSETLQLEEAERIRNQIKDEKKLLEFHWDQVAFSSKDFNRILDWIEANQDQYDELPPTHKGEDPFEDSPFGMNHVHFSAANGFMQSIDPHSGVLDKRTWDKIRSESEDSSFEGIGAMLRGGGYQSVIVETPLANSPALRSGLRAGDIIKKVDGKSIDGLSLSEVVKRIRGPKDTVVTLGIERPPVMTAHDIHIKRSVISQKAVSSEFLADENIGVIKISSFLYDGTETSEMVSEEYRDLVAKAGGELDGLLIDLRNNPGGFLDESINVAGLFLKRGSVVVQTRGRGTGLRPRKTYSNPIVPGDLPIIVLINAGSASASEIVASALMDHNRALVIGERSFGKASVQEMQPANNGIIVKLTTARYYAPRGYTIQVYGVQPDINVSDELDGTFPPRFREEDMWKHLPELTKREADAQRDNWVKSIQARVGSNTEEEQYIKKHKSDARRPDFMLIRALGYMKALQKSPAP